MDIDQDIFDTKTDPGATEWCINDDVIRLREWGTDIIHRLPQAPWDSAVIGTAESCALQVVDPSGFTSPVHARLDRGPAGWLVRDLASKNGTRVDGARRCEVRLGAERARRASARLGTSRPGWPRCGARGADRYACGPGACRMTSPTSA